jgi:hypothetical protein
VENEFFLNVLHLSDVRIFLDMYLTHLLMESEEAHSIDIPKNSFFGLRKSVDPSGTVEKYFSVNFERYDLTNGRE